jgi:hypothetical protein
MMTEFVAFGTDLSQVDFRHVDRCKGWRLGDQALLIADAECLYSGLKPKPRRILDFWLDNEIRTYRAVDMVSQLGLRSPRALAGATGSYPKKDKECGERGLPFHWNRTAESGTFYWMERDIRDLFIAARERCRQRDNNTRN